MSKDVPEANSVKFPQGDARIWATRPIQDARRRDVPGHATAGPSMRPTRQGAWIAETPSTEITECTQGCTESEFGALRAIECGVWRRYARINARMSIEYEAA